MCAFLLTQVEGMTDGFDDKTAYGYDYGPGAVRIFARNSGMFFIQATAAASKRARVLEAATLVSLLCIYRPPLTACTPMGSGHTRV